MSEQFSAGTIERMEDALVGIVQGELVEWGNSRKAADYGDIGIRQLMNECSGRINIRIKSLLAAYTGERLVAMDEYGRPTVWVAAEITPATSGDAVKDWWDEAEAAVLAKVNQQAAELELLREALKNTAHAENCTFREWDCSQPDCTETHSSPCNCGKSEMVRHD